VRPLVGPGPDRTRGNSTRLEHNPPEGPRAIRYPQACRPVRKACGRTCSRRLPTPVPGHRGDLTLESRAAYRSSVTRCRRVPHVHDRSGREFLADGVRGRAVPVRTRGSSYQHCPRSSDTCLADRRRDVPELHRSDAREQAYVPAEQPPAPQGARFPAAHAHPRRSFDPVFPAAQGPQEPRGLILDPTGS
jgi:hypothetical protein